MAKIIKFPLKMADGFGARTLEELREHADVSSIAAYYDNGKLHRWLLANYLDDNAKEIDSIKESFKNEYNKIDTKKIQKIYESLGISKIDEKQLSDFLENDVTEVTTYDLDFDFDDNSEIKSSVAKYANNNLNDWIINAQETDEKDIYIIQIANTKINASSRYNLKKDENFFFRIATFINNYEHSLKSKLLKHELIKKIRETSLSLDGKTVKFGNYDWNVVSRDESSALLVCECAVVSRHWYEIDPENCKKVFVKDWLNTVFLNDAFSDENKSYLLDYYGEKVSLLGSKDLEPFYPYTRKRKLKSLKTYFPWWTSEGNIIDKNGGLIDSNSQKNGVVPAIRISLIE